MNDTAQKTEDEKRPEEWTHDRLMAYVTDRIGRRDPATGTMIAPFGPLPEGLVTSLVLGLTDQLSAYCELTPGSDLKLGPVSIREGEQRSYLFAELTDRGQPLRLRETMARFELEMESNFEAFAFNVNARRWAWVDRYLTRFLDPLLMRTVEVFETYYARRPHAKVTVGLVRFLEDVHQTKICAEIDDRSVYGTQDPRSRYLVQ